MLRISPELHRNLQLAAEQKQLSLNQYCTRQLSTGYYLHTTTVSDRPYGISVSLLKDLFVKAGLPVIAGLVFGSVSRGDATNSSDLDLLFVLATNQVPTREHYAQWDKLVMPTVRSWSGWEIAPQFVALPSAWEQAGSLWFEVAVEGKMLWEDDPSVSKFLLQIRQAMAEGKLVRKSSHGHPYWIREGGSDEK